MQTAREQGSNRPDGTIKTTFIVLAFLLYWVLCTAMQVTDQTKAGRKFEVGHDAACQGTRRNG